VDDPHLLPGAGRRDVDTPHRGGARHGGDPVGWDCGIDGDDGGNDDDISLITLEVRGLAAGKAAYSR
jgi:hypothetical protein